MLYSLPTLTIATRYGVHKSTVHRWAKREGWASIPHTGKGAGDDWLIHSLPKDRQRFLNKAHAKEAARALALEHTEAERKQPERMRHVNSSLNGISERGQRVVEAQLYLGNYALNLHKTTGRAISNIQFEIASQFENRTGNFPEFVYQNLKGASRGSIRNWMKRAEEEGVRGLAKNYAPRAARNYIDTTPKLKKFVEAMLFENPHVSAVMMRNAAVARFGPGGKDEDPTIKIPCERRWQDYLKNWKIKNEQVYQYIQNPDAFKSSSQIAFGDAAAHVFHLNQEWQTDSTKCDLILNDGQRHNIVQIIDVYSRRVRLHVSRTSSAAAVASCLRKAMLDWGVPETLKTDNGSDYVSNHMQRVLAVLGIFHEPCKPFTPEGKPHVERAFKTFLHQHIEIMPGYIGHNVAERIAIESRKSFANRLGKAMMDEAERVELAMSPEELQDVCDTWANHIYGDTPHSGIGKVTPNAKAAAYTGEIRRITDERALDALLLPCPGNNGIRTVNKEGVRVTVKRHGISVGGLYFSEDIVPLVHQQVLVRMDEAELGVIRMYNPETHEYLGRAENPELMGYTDEKVRDISVASKKKQKALLAKQRKHLKEVAKEVGVQNIGLEMVEVAKRRGAEKQNVSAATVVDYTNTALEQAARSVTGDFTPPTEAQHEAAMARLMDSEPKPKAFVVPENISERMDLWVALYDRCLAGPDKFTEEEENWFHSYAKSAVCQAHCELNGIIMPKPKDKNKDN